MNILNKSYVFTFYSILICILFIACIPTKKTNANPTPKLKIANLNNQTEKNYHLIIFIHGTILPTPSAKSFQNALDSKNKKTFYQNYLDELRTNSPYIHQPIGEKGLHKIDLNIKNFTFTTTNLILAKYLEIYKKENPQPTADIILYTFGWDGELNHKNRLKSSNILYEELNKELTSIKESNNAINIKITLIAHSHGGNVALNLAKSEQNFKKNIKIDELLLFGTPIQEETKNLSSSKTFDMIYNFYSTGDAVQTADIISTSGKSERRFNDFKNFPKIIDVEVKLEKEKPRHSEFWFYKYFWLYRKDLMLSPYPIVVFAESMKQLVEKAKTQNKLTTKKLLMTFKQKNKKLKIYLRTQKDNHKICSRKFENYF